jgi:hypothetical protein
MHPTGQLSKGNELAIALVQNVLDAGASVVFDGNFYHLEQLEDLILRLPEGATVFTLKASLDTCVSRDRGRATSYGVGAAAAVHFLVSRFDYGVSIDTDGETAEQVVAEICGQAAACDPESVRSARVEPLD